MARLPERCVDGATRLSKSEISVLSTAIHEEWTIVGEATISRRLKVQDFKAALALVNAIGEAAEAHNHHPDLLIANYCYVTITLSTHDAGGITVNDFVMARQADALAINHP